MADPELPEPQAPRLQGRRIRKKAVKLTGREYLPMLLALAFWALTALAIGHADTARLLAVTVLVRAGALLVSMSSITAVRRRWHGPAQIRHQAMRVAALIQAGSVVVLAAMLFPLDLFFRSQGQPMVADMLPLVALGIPARFYRSVDLRTHSQLYRLWSTGAGLAGAVLAYALHAGPLGFALAFGLREWVAALFTGLIQKEVRRARIDATEALSFSEVARDTVVASRRRLTYRISKNLLAVLGPVGNAAARTGRGLNWHSRLEPYMPHRRGGFALFALLTAGIAMFLIIRSGEPLALIAAAGFLQVCAIALNVLLWWRYLPDRSDPDLQVEDDDD